MIYSITFVRELASRAPNFGWFLAGRAFFCPSQWSNSSLTRRSVFFKERLFRGLKDHRNGS
jgi:hypothetical protein